MLCVLCVSVVNSDPRSFGTGGSDPDRAIAFGIRGTLGIRSTEPRTAEGGIGQHETRRPADPRRHHASYGRARLFGAPPPGPRGAGDGRPRQPRDPVLGSAPLALRPPVAAPRAAVPGLRQRFSLFRVVARLTFSRKFGCRCSSRCPGCSMIHRRNRWARPAANRLCPARSSRA